MKNVIFVALVALFALSCGGNVFSLGDDSVLGSELSNGDAEMDGEMLWNEGAAVICEAGIDCNEVEFCKYVCEEFDFTQCVSTIMRSLPVGETVRGDTCTDRCSMAINLYEHMSGDTNFECLGKAASCSAVAFCLGVK